MRLRFLISAGVGLGVATLGGGGVGTGVIDTSPARAEDAAPPVLVLDAIEVHGRRPDETSDATAFATVVPLDQVPGALKTVADVLAETPGVQVRRYGGLGDFATVSIRGSTPGQVRFFLDEIPLSRARSDAVNVSGLPTDQLQSIEVFRGTSPLSVPAVGLAGVVNLVTRRPAATPEAFLLAGGGSFGTRKVTGSASTRGGEWGLLGSASYLGSEGDFPFVDDNGTLANPGDDEVVRRQNNAFNRGEALVRAERPVLDATRLSVVDDVYVNQQGVPGIGANQSTNANLKELRNVAYTRLDGEQASGLLYTVIEEQRFDDPQGEIGLGRQKTRNLTVAPGIGVHTLRSIAGVEIEARMDVGGEVFVPRNFIGPNPTPPTQARWTFGLGTGATWQLLEDAILVLPQLRWEHAVDRFGGTVDPSGQIVDDASGGTHDLFTPRLGLAWRALPGLVVKANGGQYERLPTFTELFGNEGSVVGNPDLSPETGQNADGGVVWNLDHAGWLGTVRLETDVFLADVDDLIVLVQNSQRVAVPRNVAATRTWGVELATSVRPVDGLQFVLNYTFQDPRDESGIPARDGNQIPGQPRNDLYFRAQVDLPSVAGFALGSAYYELSYLTDVYLDQANFLRVPARTIHGIGGEVPVPATPLTATWEVLNLTDDQVSDILGFPLPGRSFFLGLRWRWQADAPEAVAS